MAQRIRIRAMLAGLSVLMVLGCGDDGLGKRYAVTGVVRYKGNPVDQGTITFEPLDARGRIAAGTIAGGRYSFTTLQPDDGALPGKYRVTLVSQDIDAALATDPYARKAEDPQKRVAAAQKVAKRLIPARYQLAETSRLTAEVEARWNTFDFELAD